MPTVTYEELLTEAMPSFIETEQEHEKAGRRFGELLRKGVGRTPDETKLMRLLALVVEDYDRRNAMPPDDSPPGETLQFLMQHSGKAASDLLPVFGQRSHVSEALSGKRPITAVQARKLGKLFGVKPGLFV